jgi:predicted phage terminase large subunit-like protein
MIEHTIERIQPQKGKQEDFLASDADVVLYGGSAGSGKSWCMLLDPLRYVNVPGFYAVLFRRTYPEIKNPGGLWDESWKVYPHGGGESRAIDYAWEWPSGARVKMSHMEHAKDRYSWQGSQIAWIGFDEVTHFDRDAVLYMFSRNRSMCGVKPKIRMTCNPDSESWVRKMIDWWIDPETGLAIEERCAKVRWFTIENDKFVWSDKWVEGYKSFQFIAAKLSDNQKLIQADPGYINNLRALPLVERERLLGGNWNISNKGGIIKAEWLQKTYEGVKPYLQIIQSWDTAFKAADINDPSCCTTWGVWEGGIDLLDVINERLEYPILKARIIQHAKDWKPDVVLIEDKASGQSLIQELRAQTKIPVKPIMPTVDKITRASVCSLMFENGKVHLPADFKGWKSDYTSQLLAFPNGKHDDCVDSSSQALSYYMHLDVEEMQQRNIYELAEEEFLDYTVSQGNMVTGY